ncbi:MAG: serine hydrolase [Bacteroidetes bacterium]|jgi:CubicO group peptidase (beta-lactamase class C family)|nr:serine hydrolase [Bacteroidota bacterium]
MKIIRKILIGFLILFIGGMVFLYFYITIPSVRDGETLGRIKFPSNNSVFKFPEKLQPLPNLDDWLKPNTVDKYSDANKFLADHNVIGFLVLHKDTIVYENYFNGFKKGDITQVFSVTKALVTPLLGLSIDNGYVKSINQPVSDFLTDLPPTNNFDALTLYHLAQMQSGIDQDEYADLLKTMHFYFERNIKDQVKKSFFKYKPGDKFVYKSVDTQLLGECLEVATGKSFLDLFYQNIWSKLGIESDSYWSIDSKKFKNPKMYGGLNASLPDIAKFCSMYMHDGVFRGEQIIPKKWVNFCDDKNERKGADNYCMGWWMDMDDEKQNIYYGAGFNGQVMFINETTQTAIIKIGEGKGGVNWYNILKRLSNAYD